MRRLIIVGLLAVSLAACTIPEPADNYGGEEPASETTTAKTVKAGTVLLTKTGKGSHTSKTFTTPDSWDLRWSYDCSDFGYSGNFIVFGEGDLSGVVAVNQLGRRDRGVEHLHEGGKGHLSINSTCSWTVRAVTA